MCAHVFASKRQAGPDSEEGGPGSGLGYYVGRGSVLVRPGGLVDGECVRDECEFPVHACVCVCVCVRLWDTSAASLLVEHAIGKAAAVSLSLDRDAVSQGTGLVSSSRAGGS